MAFPHEEESSAIVQLKEVGAHLGTTFSAARYDSKADTLSRLSYDELTQLHIAPSAREQEPKEHASDSSRHPSEAIDRTRNTLGYQRVSIACGKSQAPKCVKESFTLFVCAQVLYSLTPTSLMSWKKTQM